MKKNITLELIERARNFNTRTAIIDGNGSYSFQQLLKDSSKAASLLLNGKSDLEEARIAFLVPSSYEYVVWQWGIWQAGGIAVPLCVSHPSKELEYVINDTDCKQLISHVSFSEKINPLRAINHLNIVDVNSFKGIQPVALPAINFDRRAMIIYTSGTTGKPKGVVTTHQNIHAQITSLIDAWEWTKDDYILNCLPLHHVHGVINVLSCSLWAGAKCHMIPKFKSALVWSLFSEAHPTLFMAVPTIYHKLIQYFDQADSQTQEKLKTASKKLRLMVSGSAALPVSVLKKWKTISSHTLLERYGMTEIGMALSNSYSNERIPGHVGKPLPGVSVKIVNDEGQNAASEESGELRIKGSGVFLEYWRKPEATKQAFIDGWFCTGDIVTINENGIFKIVGRNSVDIIKTGGFKVSALEIEEELRSHKKINECAVVGIPDEEWGQRVALAACLLPGEQLAVADLKSWAKDRLAPYKIPSTVKILEKLPRNAMGKVMKPKIVALFK